MNAEQKSNPLKWIKALRSNRYKQCGGYLAGSMGHAKPDSFCAIGLGYKVLFKPKWQIAYRYDNQAEYKPDGVKLSTCGIPVGFASVVGLSSAKMRKVVNMNDSGQKFTEIADYLAKHVKGI